MSDWGLSRLARWFAWDRGSVRVDSFNMMRILNSQHVQKTREYERLYAEYMACTDSKQYDGLIEKILVAHDALVQIEQQLRNCEAEIASHARRVGFVMTMSE